MDLRCIEEGFGVYDFVLLFVYSGAEDIASGGVRKSDLGVYILGVMFSASSASATPCALR